MTALEFSRRHVAALQELGVRLLDRRKPGTPLASLARELLGGFYDLCLRAGLDQVLAELAAAHPPLDPSDRAELIDHPALVPALVAQLEAIKLDGGGPRAAKPRQLADAVVAALGLTLVDEPPHAAQLGGDVRAEVAAAIMGAVERELALPKLRDTMVAGTRMRLEPHHHDSFAKLVPRLDERGTKITSQAKVPLDAVHAVQRAIFATRTDLITRVGTAAIDRTKAVIARTDADAAARIDQPVSLRLTPREVAIARACDATVPMTPVAVAEELLTALTELSRIAWKTVEAPARPYKASETFAVGDHVEHPTFGRGTVTSELNGRIEVSFPDAKRTLVHARK